MTWYRTNRGKSTRVIQQQTPPQCGEGWAQGLYPDDDCPLQDQRALQYSGYQHGRRSSRGPETEMVQGPHFSLFQETGSGENVDEESSSKKGVDREGRKKGYERIFIELNGARG